MKILLVYPYFLEERVHTGEIAAVPLGLYYVGAVMKQRGYDVEILNWHNIHKAPNKIQETLMEKHPDIIGFSVVHANRWGGLDIARIAKMLDPDVTVVFGGIGATFSWEHFLTHFPQVDYCVIGEGEYSFPELAGWLENPEGKGPETIPGIAFKKNGKTVKTPCGPPVETPDRLPDPAEYFTFEHVALSRGCPGNCTFCGSPKFWGRRVRFHSARYFVDQLQRLYFKGVNFFFVSDDTFALKKDLAVEVCREIIQRKLPVNWAAICRVRDMDENLLHWMRRAGCIQISYGIESGSAEIRKRLGKPLADDMIQKAFSLTTAHGILPRAYFIYGCPGESDATINKTLSLIRKIKPLSAIFYILDIFPGTALYESYKKDAKVTDDIWLERVEDILYFETDPNLTSGQILAFGKRLREEFHRMLPQFAESIALKDDRELYPFHADFLSRMGMTFSHGDYSRLEEIPNPDDIAQKLHEKALAYYPDHRAFLGLGMIYQKKGMHERSAATLEKGLKFFPESRQLEICLGVTWMNMGRLKKALAHFEKYPYAPDAQSHAEACKKALALRADE